MRRLAVLALCVVLALTGCQAPGSTGGHDSLDASASTGGDAAATPATDTESTAQPVVAGDAPPDPQTDRLGWENGYWHNESLPVTTEDGLNESERAAVVARSMARVEVVRRLEFDTTVPVGLVSRAEYRNRSGGGSPGPALRRFDNAKFEALLLVGEDRGSIAVQDSTLGESVLGFYSGGRDEIVLVTDSETPTIDELTLAHELVHALQDQQFGLASDARTRDGVQGRNGLIEGDATAVEQAYDARCGEQWDCLAGGGGGGGGGGDRHFGINFMLYFPYSDGPGLVNDLRDRGGWAAVDDAYDDRPDGAREVIAPSEYPDWEREPVDLADRTTGDWDRVRPSTDRDRPDYAVVGPSAIAASLAYTLTDDYNESSAVAPQDVINFEDDGSVDSSDPYNYDLPATDGWAGGRMHVYSDGTETAYVWKTVWDTDRDAREFATAWEGALAHWGGTERAEGTWVLAADSPFADAVAVRVDGRTVTVVNAPTAAELDEVHDA
ncbi:Hvo_1808 family surface protein [Halomicroarcula sp. GCM10025709]|uniref:Hvo_1808 family surface protein n=1 Tax=Haloarcula TaxID=2237 RepID=UPI0024C471E7|nr:Hvo_1808 family surface protein [Halomicroarcula sp. YJ-61-S]